MQPRTTAARALIGKTVQADMAAIQDDTIARLADEYEKGAVLSFFFADQLKGIESAALILLTSFQT
jgi:hypothetical protein